MIILLQRNWREKTVVELKELSDDSLWLETKTAAQKEKAETVKLLHYLHEVERRRLYAKHGHSSLFTYVHRELGYSEAETSLRIGAMRLIFSVPEAKFAIESEALSLTTAYKLQSFF